LHQNNQKNKVIDNVVKLRRISNEIHAKRDKHLTQSLCIYFDNYEKKILKKEADKNPPLLIYFTLTVGISI